MNDIIECNALADGRSSLLYTHGKNGLNQNFDFIKDFNSFMGNRAILRHRCYTKAILFI